MPNSSIIKLKTTFINWILNCEINKDFLPCFYKGKYKLKKKKIIPIKIKKDICPIPFSLSIYIRKPVIVNYFQASWKCM